MYFEYFLSQSLAGRLAAGNGLGQFLDRGVLPDDVVDGALEPAGGLAVADVANSAVSAALRHENRRRNAGAIVAAWTRHHGPLVNTSLSGLSFVDIDFGAATFENVKFENCEFTGSRFDRITFKSCEAIGSRFQGIVVTNDSNMDLEGLIPGANFGSLIHPDVDREVFSPEDVREVLRRLGAPLPGALENVVSYSTKATVLLHLLSMMMRAYRRSNVLFETDEFLSKLFQSPHWPDLKNQLTEHELVREETRSASGPSARVYRLLVSVDELVNMENAVELPENRLGEFWSGMRSL